MTVVLLVVVLVAATCQRATGMGFAMVLAPFAVLALGPTSGVVLVNALGIVSALLVLVRVRRDVDWRTFLVLSPPAVLGIVATVLVSTSLSAPVAQVTAGAVMLVALVGSMLVRRGRVVRRSMAATGLAGAVSGATTAIAGMGGSAMAVLAIVTRWEPRLFAATMQPYFAMLGVVTIAVRQMMDPQAWPQLELWAWCAIAVVMVVGTVLAERLRFSAAMAQRAVVVIAAVGAVSAVVDGVRALQ